MPVGKMAMSADIVFFLFFKDPNPGIVKSLVSSSSLLLSLCKNLKFGYNFMYLKNSLIQITHNSPCYSTSYCITLQINNLDLYEALFECQIIFKNTCLGTACASCAWCHCILCCFDHKKWLSWTVFQNWR